MTSLDLSRYRVIYAALALAMLPRFSWVADYPDGLFTPPPGVMRLFGGFPPAWTLIGMEGLLALSLTALLVGVGVNTASVVAALAMLVGSGFTFSLGKIDHVVLMILTPLFLVVAGWDGRREVQPWVLRLFAYVIGLAVLSAGMGKLLGGWLDPSTHATREWAVMYQGWGSAGPLAESLLTIHSGWLWEPMDIAAVALECLLIVLVVNWRAFRVGLALLAVFHLAVALLFGIVFSLNVLVYAAFVPWGRVARWPPSTPHRLMVPVAAAAWAISNLAEGQVHRVLGPVVLALGAAVGVLYLVKGAPLPTSRRHLTDDDEAPATSRNSVDATRRGRWWERPDGEAGTRNGPC